MATLRLVVLSGGMRVPSTTRLLADRLAEAAVSAIEAHGDRVQLTVVDIRDHAHGLADAMLTGFPTGELAEDLAKMASADALIAVTPTFQGSYSGLFKSFIDLVAPDVLTGVPVILGATGGSERHSLMLEHALRPLFAHLGADPVRTAVYAATADFGSGEGTAIATRTRRAGQELAARLGAGRHSPTPRKTPVDPYSEGLVPFEQMLANLSRA